MPARLRRGLDSRLQYIYRVFAKVFQPEVLKENLLVFFKMQGDDGNIIDGFIPKEKVDVDYDYIYSEFGTTLCRS